MVAIMKDRYIVAGFYCRRFCFVCFSFRSKKRIKLPAIDCRPGKEFALTFFGWTIVRFEEPQLLLVFIILHQATLSIRSKIYV